MILCPSMMCADYTNLAQEILKLEEAGADIFHCDIMDGNFVPNITLGLMDVKTICSLSKKMVDVHLMIDKPSTKVDLFLDAGVNIIYIHSEAEPQTIKTLMYIKSRNKYAGLAVNPDTSFSQVEEILPHCDYVLIMSVFPGFSGQSFICSVDKKIKSFVKRKKEFGYKVILDGACSLQVIDRYFQLGVDGFVLGQSALFRNSNNYKENMEKLRTLK